MATSDDRIGQKLLQLKKRIEDEKTKQSELKGELKSVMNQLEQEFNTRSLTDAAELLESMQENLNALERTIQEKFKKAQELFGGQQR